MKNLICLFNEPTPLPCNEKVQQITFNIAKNATKKLKCARDGVDKNVHIHILDQQLYTSVDNVVYQKTETKFSNTPSEYFSHSTQFCNTMVTAAMK